MRCPSPSTLLVSVVGSLVTLGVIMLFSTSGILGEVRHDDAFFFLKRQFLWIGLGVTALVVTSRVHYRTWRLFAVPLAVFTLVLLFMTILPGIGVEISGSRRWLRMGKLNFQPSELAKLSSVLLLAWWMARIQRDPGSFKQGFCIPGFFVGLFAILIVLEPDFGTAILVAAVGLAVMFIGGSRLSYLLVSGMAGLCGMGLLIAQDPERRNRILAFLDPERYQNTDAYQLRQAVYAFVTGGGTGVGLGDSMQKRHYLPEAHTDFIFAILGEELGFRITLPVLLAYFLIFLCGLKIIGACQDRFGRLLAFGLTFLITLQAAVNIGVVTGSLPTKGISLPFISYGGSSMLMSFTMVGILINISYDVSKGQEDEDRRFIKDRARSV